MLEHVRPNPRVADAPPRACTGMQALQVHTGRCGSGACRRGCARQAAVGQRGNTPLHVAPTLKWWSISRARAEAHLVLPTVSLGQNFQKGGERSSTERKLECALQKSGRYEDPTPPVARTFDPPLRFTVPTSLTPQPMALRGEYDDEEEDAGYDAAFDPDAKMVAHDIIAQYAGGQAIGNNIQWVLRAMQGLERHYHALRRDDGKRRARLDKLVSQLSERLEETSEALAAERRARAASDAELARARAELEGQARGGSDRAAGGGLQQQLQHQQRQQQQQREELDGCRHELVQTQERFAQADAAARYWSQQAAQAQAQARTALQESQEAKAAKVALQKCLIREKDYQLSEQAGYRLDAVVQIAPMHPTITVFGGAARGPPPDANALETHTLDPWRKGTL